MPVKSDLSAQWKASFSIVQFIANFIAKFANVGDFEARLFRTGDGEHAPTQGCRHPHPQLLAPYSVR